MTAMSGIDCVREQVPLRERTWFKLGGAAQFFAEPNTLDELLAVISRCHDEALQVRLLGGGSKVLVRDEHTLPPDILRRHEAAKREVLAEFTAIVQAGIDSGEFRDRNPHVMALSVIGMCNWSVWWFNPKASMTGAQVGELIAEMAVRAVSRSGSVNGARTPKSTLREIRTNLAELERLIGDGR